MACSGCAKRRAAIVIGARSLAKGDAKEAVEQMKFIARSAADDAQSVFKAKIAASRSKLGRR